MGYQGVKQSVEVMHRANLIFHLNSKKSLLTQKAKLKLSKE